jgi:predicted RNA-binding Zn-ribbon protein involved in translation (DUF1610 family)
VLSYFSFRDRAKYGRPRDPREGSMRVSALRRSQRRRRLLIEQNSTSRPLDSGPTAAGHVQEMSLISDLSLYAGWVLACFYADWSKMSSVTRRGVACDKEEIQPAYADGRAEVGSFKSGARANFRSRSDCAPMLQTSSHTVNYQCGECGTVLLRAEEGQVHNFLICTKCDAYNSTDL